MYKYKIDTPCIVCKRMETYRNVTFPMCNIAYGRHTTKTLTINYNTIKPEQ